MPQARPRDNPNAKLSPLDKACDRKITDPDRYGEDAGIAWAAWEMEHSTEDRTYFQYVMVRPNGKTIKKEKSGRYKQRTPYHTAPSVQEIKRICTALADPSRGIEKYRRDLPEPESTIEDVRRREYERAQALHGTSHPSRMQRRDPGNRAGKGSYR